MNCIILGVFLGVIALIFGLMIAYKNLYPACPKCGKGMIETYTGFKCMGHE